MGEPLVEIELKPIQLEESVSSLIENAASQKSGVPQQIEEIKSNVASVKTGLEEKIDQLAVRSIEIFLWKSYKLFVLIKRKN